MQFAKIRNAAYLVRHYRRPGDRQARARARAVRELAAAVMLALADPAADPEAILYATAAALYERGDPRFF